MPQATVTPIAAPTEQVTISKGRKAIVTGHEGTVDAAARLAADIDKQQAQLDALKTELKAIGDKHIAGKVSTAQLQGTDGRSARVTAAGFKPLPVDKWADHDHAAALLTPKLTLKVKRGADISKLVDAMGDAGLSVGDWFELGQVLAPVEDFEDAARAAGADDMLSAARRPRRVVL